MQLEQSFDLPVPREAAWSAFQDVALLISCMPGASLRGEPTADPLEFGFAVKLGPIATNFSGQGKLTYGTDHKGVLEGTGTDRGTGSRVKGSATFELEETEGGTRVRLVVDYALTGALAQVGRSGIVRELAAGITRQFAENLRSNLAKQAAGLDASGVGSIAADGGSAPAVLDAGALLWNVVKAQVRGVMGADETADEDRDSGLTALLSIRPQWTNLAPASDVVPLEGRWLLHAGPPLADPLSPPAPLLSSAVLACLYEGWATTEGEAERLVASGEVRLQPAQDHRCVTPLAALITPSTTMIVVEDWNKSVPAAYAPLGTIGGADLRFGTRDTEILGRLALRDGEHARTLADALAEPVDLIVIAADAVGQGDDLHNRTTAATQILAALLDERYRAAGMDPRPGVAQLSKGLVGTPHFFLTFWMAAAKLMLSAAEEKKPRTLVTRLGGNGEVFGVSLAARPDVWITTPAGAPRGAYLPGVDPASEPLGAIGDSAVIEALGFGGLALHVAPEARAVLQAYLPPDADSIASSLLAAAHPAFARAGVRVGLDALRVMESGVAPVVTLGMVEKTGCKGLMGRGVFLPGKELFARAVQAIGS